MKAEEARKLVRKHQSQDRSIFILRQIEDAAKRGESSIEVGDETPATLQRLRDLGYNVTNVFSYKYDRLEPAPWGKEPRGETHQRNRWRISW